jgi:hypothetical protein
MLSGFGFLVFGGFCKGRKYKEMENRKEMEY